MERVKRDDRKGGECRQLVASERPWVDERVSLAGTPIQTRPMRAKHYLRPSPFFSLVLSVYLIISIVISHTGGRWFLPASSCNVGLLFDLSTFRLCSRAVDQRLPTLTEWIYLLPLWSLWSCQRRYQSEAMIRGWKLSHTMKKTEQVSIDWTGRGLSLDLAVALKFRCTKKLSIQKIDL